MSELPTNPTSARPALSYDLEAAHKDLVKAAVPILIGLVIIFGSFFLGRLNSWENMEEIGCFAVGIFPIIIGFYVLVAKCDDVRAPSYYEVMNRNLFLRVTIAGGLALFFLWLLALCVATVVFLLFGSSDSASKSDSHTLRNLVLYAVRGYGQFLIVLPILIIILCSIVPFKLSKMILGTVLVAIGTADASRLKYLQDLNKDFQKAKKF